MTTTLITGANKGLGRETARRLIALGHTVYLGARDRDRGQEAANAVGGRFVALDVTSDASVQAAAAVLEQEAGHLDVLVNNAGVAGSRIPAAETTADHVLAVYQVNVLGPVRVIHAMLPLLDRSETPVIVNVSSGLGSLAYSTDPEHLESTLVFPAYSSSKAALNMLTSQYAKALPRYRINAVDPGFTATDLNAHRGTKTVEQGAEIIVTMATIGAHGPTGTFVDEDGTVPW